MTKKTDCEHLSSSLERQKMLDYECEGEVSFLIHDICNDCGKLLGKEKHIFKFSYREEIED